MPQQILQNNVTLLVQRESINSNFTELYESASAALTKVEADSTFIKTINNIVPDAQGNVSLSQSSGDLTFIFVQAGASDTWVINHNLGKFPSCTVMDSAGDEVEGMINHIDTNSLTIMFSAPFSGKAQLN